MSFEKMGIDRSDIQKALSRVKTGELGRWNTPSRNTYILCPVDRELWDLKPVVGLLWEDADPNSRPEEWVTNTNEKDLRERGFFIVKFKLPDRRKLGIVGCDIGELTAEHTVYSPNEEPAENGLLPEEVEILLPEGQKRTVTISPYVRNSAYKKQIIEQANNLCNACKNGSFQMPNGNQYLEAHHKTWLSEGGPDILENMVALCPNCHMQEHHGMDRLYPNRDWV